MITFTSEQLIQARKDMVEAAAAVCLAANVECYKFYKQDILEMGEEPSSFEDFGTDPETVEIILEGMNEEVSKLLIEAHKKVNLEETFG